MKNSLVWLLLTLWLVVCALGSTILYLTHKPIFEMELEFVVLTTETERPYEQQQMDQAFINTYTKYLLSHSFLSTVSDESPTTVRKRIKIDTQPGNYLVTVRIRDEDQRTVKELALCVSNQWLEDSEQIFRQQNVQLLTNIEEHQPQRIDLLPWQRSCIWILGITFLFCAGYSFWRRFVR
ncbi:hypothetical protein ACFO0S_08705 [Chryseomicrobium palamuruense]|uniref:Uncharacterized protein n=1 Tax=Chryseomicrobium palamuruense TaxID=682973 RepID=A0ABV8UVZ0_9BACL